MRFTSIIFSVNIFNVYVYAIGSKNYESEVGGDLDNGCYYGICY